MNKGKELNSVWIVNQEVLQICKDKMRTLRRVKKHNCEKMPEECTLVLIINFRNKNDVQS